MTARWQTPRKTKAAAEAALFVAGFAVLALLCDRAVGWYTARTAGRHLIGREVYAVQQRLKQPDPAVRAVYLGDSVSRQLFVPGEEPVREIRYLTSNQAISMAGQYYLLRTAVDRYPNLEEVLLLYSAGAWRNDLDEVYMRDYFCGYFHSPEQIAELFSVKHDWGLSFAHIARAVLPNLIALNSAMSVGHASAGVPMEEPESAAPAEPASEPVVVSRASAEFLKRIRRLCAEKGVRLRVLPCPASDRLRFEDVTGVYDQPFLYLPRQLFRGDGVHLKDVFVPEVRVEVEKSLRLHDRELATPAHQAVVGAPGGDLSRVGAGAGSLRASPKTRDVAASAAPRD